MASTTRNLLSISPHPKIYAYTTPEYAQTPWQSGNGRGLLKVGFTTKENVDDRIRQQVAGVKMPSARPWETVLVESALRDGEVFLDKEVHIALEKMGRRRVRGEWFECTAEDVKAAIASVKSGRAVQPGRQATFALRPEQECAIEQTASYFKRYPKAREGRAPHFLWNAKMRFGKTFTSYQLAREMGWTRILVLTFKPAVQDSWESDLRSHVDFDGWQFLGKNGRYETIEESKPLVWFASFQDVLQRDSNGDIKERLEAMHLIDWDCVVLDEYHFGAWRESAKDIYDSEPSEAPDQSDFSEDSFPLSVSNYLYLSGTPFRALVEGEFTEDQIFNWTYADEQEAKESWPGAPEDNPYAELPRMVVMTYELPEALQRIALDTDRNEFDLNAFFAAEAVKDSEGRATGEYRFKHEDDVQKWLDLIRGQHLPYDERLTGDDKKRPPIPFEDRRLLASLRHTLWYLPSVAACYAMAALMKEDQNAFYRDYRVVVAAGNQAGIGIKALPPVRDAITGDALTTRSITLSCAKLTTGVTVREWSGIFMLKNTSSPESYFQAAFRVQSPWTATSVDPSKGEVKHILKEQCYVFDFAPSRALRLIVDYATELNSDSRTSPAVKVQSFLNYLPVLCYDGYSMQELEAGPLLDFVTTGTASSALARRWQSTRLIDVGHEAMQRMLEHPDLLARLEKFEGFRNLRSEVKKTISAERAIKKVKTERGPSLSKKEKKQISAAEREAQALRKRLKENLIKFTSRVPVFMYLTDFREETLIDVIENLEPDLFKRTTGLEVGDFRLLRDIGVFNHTTMNSAVFLFRRYEDASLHYAGGGKENEVFGGFDAHATRQDVIEGEV